MWQWFLKSAPIMLMHDKVWELLVYDIWEKFLYLPFFSPLFWFPLSYSGHQSFRLWTIWKISVLKNAVGRQGIGSWRKIQNKSQWLDNVSRNWQSLDMKEASRSVLRDSLKMYKHWLTEKSGQKT